MAISATEKALKKFLATFFKEHHTRQSNNRDMWGCRMGSVVYYYGAKPKRKPDQFASQITSDQLLNTKFIRILGILNSATDAEDSIAKSNQDTSGFTDVVYGLSVGILKRDDNQYTLNLILSTKHVNQIESFEFGSIEELTEVLNRVVSKTVVTKYRSYGWDGRVSNVPAVFGLYTQ